VAGRFVMNQHIGSILELEAECLRDELQSFEADARLRNRDLDAAHRTIRALEQKALLGEQAV